MNTVTSSPDWRLAQSRVVTVSDLSPSTQLQEGQVLWLSTVTIDPIDGSVVFITPSPAALALGIAIAAGRAAVQARQRVSFVLPEGARLKRPVDDRLEPLFEYFEQSMIASVLVYQCLEAYSNHVISNVITESMSLKRRGKST